MPKVNTPSVEHVSVHCVLDVFAATFQLSEVKVSMKYTFGIHFHYLAENLIMDILDTTWTFPNLDFMHECNNKGGVM